MVKETPYTGSELCVYLGIDPSKVDLSKMRATHLFYRAKMKENVDVDPTDFENKEIEACLWSRKLSNYVPEGKASVLLRVNMPYDFFSKWRTGEKKRKRGYKRFKEDLANELIEIMEEPLPGLKDAVETMEIATPLTYRDWGQRYDGSIAGWSRDVKKMRLSSKLLCRTPFQNLLACGIYSVTEPFLGGVPVSIYTADLVADFILESDAR
jgi:phytoene dehydrogenase-like protein